MNFKFQILNFKKMKIFSILFLLSILFIFGCSKKDETPKPADEGLKPVLENSAKIITATYKDLNDRTQDLLVATQNLLKAPSEANLEIARTDWREARVDWEMSEGFLFGPVDNKGLDPSIDSWPVNKIDLDNVLGSNRVLTLATVRELEPTLKGFHTIEYLLFGEDAMKPISAFTPRQFEYLVACVEALHEATTSLYNAWAPDKENFEGNLIFAGTDKSIYTSQKGALQDLVNGFAVIADEVANGKINDPFEEKNLTLEESQFSDNSKADFQNNIRSIQNLYTGKFKNLIQGESIGNWVATKNKDLDKRVQQSIQDAIDAIGAIPGTFSDAVFNNRPAVENAQKKVRDLQHIMQSEVLPLVSKL